MTMSGRVIPIQEISYTTDLDDPLQFAFQGSLYWDQKQQCYVRTAPDHLPAGQIRAAFQKGQEVAVHNCFVANLARTQAYEGQIRQLELLLQNVRTECNRLQNEQGQQDSNISSALTTVITEFKFKVDQTNKVLADKDKENVELRTALGQHSIGIQRMNGMLADKDQKLLKNRSEIRALEATNRKLNQLNVGLQGQLKTIELENKRLDGELAISAKSLTDSQEQWKRQNELLHQRLHLLTDQKVLEIRQLKDELSGFVELHKQRQECFRDMYNEMKRAVESSNKFKAKMASEAEGLKSQLEAKQHEIISIKLKAAQAEAQSLSANQSLVCAQEEVKNQNIKLMSLKAELANQIALSLSLAKESAQKEQAAQVEKKELEIAFEKLVGNADEQLKRLLVESMEMLQKKELIIQELSEELEKKDRIIQEPGKKNTRK